MKKILTYDDVQSIVEEIITKILMAEQSIIKREGIFSSARSMSYFYLEIKKKFGLQIPEEYIINHEFRSIVSICDIIYDQLKEVQ